MGPSGPSRCPVGLDEFSGKFCGIFSEKFCGHRSFINIDFQNILHKKYELEKKRQQQAVLEKCIICKNRLGLNFIVAMHKGEAFALCRRS